MASCPYCLEEIKDGARKCPHCQTSLEQSPDEASTTIYVVDKGLIRFAKFATAVLAIFVLVGAYLFGFDIKEASETASEAKLEVQQALLEIERHRATLDSKVSEIEQRVRHIEEIEREITGHLGETQSSTAEIKRLVVELRRDREEGRGIIIALRALNAGEATIAMAKREERGIGMDRGKLWAIGSTVQYHFLDGSEDNKEIVRRAIDVWQEHANLVFVETASDDAEVRISFEGPGSWSTVGTDALGVSPGEPTINLGFLEQFGSTAAKTQNALHEFGHTLGLVHEFQNPSAGEIFDRAATISYLTGAPNFWSEEGVVRTVLNKIADYPGMRPYDPNSIMHLTFPNTLLKPGVEMSQGATLSPSDKNYIASLYPKE